MAACRLLTALSSTKIGASNLRPNSILGESSQKIWWLRPLGLFRTASHATSATVVAGRGGRWRLVFSISDSSSGSVIVSEAGTDTTGGTNAMIGAAAAETGASSPTKAA